ncbi:hypothetical protein CVU37_04855 [candidate division BRC1 bacterium HGW-BRC1-1]|jgi:hypothetical protein|nr:MAG: hypothetical protein CVU37_04855 [candidate division BRC1 bacterium HGW-BRC1-1]
MDCSSFGTHLDGYAPREGDGLLGVSTPIWRPGLVETTPIMFLVEVALIVYLGVEGRLGCE